MDKETVIQNGTNLANGFHSTNENTQLALPATTTTELHPGDDINRRDPDSQNLVWEPYGELDVRAYKKRVWKNIILMSCIFLLNFISFGGLMALQSSLHIDQGMGVICTSLLYFFLVLSCLFLPKPLIFWLGHKWVVTLSLIGYILWMFANGYGVWGTMIPASIIVGICGAPLWTAQCSYFTELGKQYAAITNQDESGVIALFFGVFFMFFQSCKKFICL